MSRFKLLISGFAVIAVAVWISGCSSKSSSKKSSSGAKSTSKSESKSDSHAGHNHGGGDDHSDADHAKIEKNLAKLSAEDRALAEKQKICPVTEDDLGKMGKPIKLEIKGQSVFICCKGCQKDFEADPDKFLAKLKK